MGERRYSVIVIGGGHAGAEAAWACANLLASRGPGCVALVTLDPGKIGEMSCNPAIGGLAKGQLVREIDAMHGLMGLAADASGIQFKVLNTSRGPAVRGPRAQCDKHEYARGVRALLALRPEIETVAGSVESLVIEPGDDRRRPGEPGALGRVAGVRVLGAGASAGERLELRGEAVVLTTGTFLRGLMHTGESRTPGGRFGEGAAHGLSDELRRLGFELGRLKTGTPPRLRRSTIDWDGLATARGDERPEAFSVLSAGGGADGRFGRAHPLGVLGAFPRLEQVDCRQTRTSPEAHAAVRANLHRAPMFSGQIEGVGPRYCPSLEDKVVRFAERESHGVFLEPESLGTDWVYCNGISTSLPTDVQDVIVRTMPGCGRAEILRYGYAVEYDFVPAHQTRVTGESRRVSGLYLAGQINGTSGYEEAAAQGLVAGINAARRSLGLEGWCPGREEAYLGVLMDDLVTKTPREPYRMFTSRAEHRLLLRADNADDRLTPVADRLGLLDGSGVAGELGARRRAWLARRSAALAAVHAAIDAGMLGDVPMGEAVRRTEFTPEDLRRAVTGLGGGWSGGVPGGGWAGVSDGVWASAHADRRYGPYVERQRREVRRQAEQERRRLPAGFDYDACPSLRPEARQALRRFRPETFGQASRLEGITPADLTLLAVLVRARGGSGAGAEAGGWVEASSGPTRAGAAGTIDAP